MKNIKKVLLCHPQTQHSHKVAMALFNSDMLLKFVNPLVLSKKESFLPAIVERKVKNRIIDVPKEYLESNWFLEFRRIFEQKILKRKGEEQYFRVNERFQNSVSQTLIKRADIVIGFDSSSWLLAKRVKDEGKIFILDRTIAHHTSSKPIYKEGREMYPSWENEFRLPISDRYIDLENRELQLADVITVGGSFAKKTLVEQGVEESKIYINSYGIDMNALYPMERQLKSPIRFLFFGTIGARKGIAALLKAWELLDTTNAELLLAGYGQLPAHIKLPKNIKVLGEIHPSKRNELFNSVHVLVFPSLFEGFGQVLSEGAATGLPLITTYNTGGVELIKDGTNGFLIKANDYGALAEKIQFFINNPEKIEIMGNARLSEVRKSFSLQAYEERWLNLIKSFD